MDLRDLDPLLDSTADLVQRLVVAQPDDPGLLASIEALQATIEERAGPEHLDHVRDRFQCLLGSLGLIPSDNEGETCN